MNKYLLTVLNYFEYFAYAPFFDEIYTFFPHKISKKTLKSLLIEETEAKTIIRLSQKSSDKQYSLFQSSSSHYTLVTNHSLYTLPQYSIPTSPRLRGAGSIKNSWNILTIQRYIEILQAFPFVRFVGVTGTSAMRGFRKNDDLDLCIVAKHGLLWTTRFFTVALAKILRIHTQTGVCLNLFFDESDLIIPLKKHNSYIAHELLQMKPISDKNRVYQRFLDENEWIYTFFPNAPHVTPANPPATQGFIALRAGVGIQKRKLYRSRIKFGMTQRMEWLFKSIQFPIIHRNRAAFLITPTQLWLFKNDFEKKLKRSGLVI